MDGNYLITGYWGEPHVTAENDRGINAAIFGTGKFVLNVGKKFKAEYIGNNTVRMYDGKLLDNGAAVGIPTGEYVDLYIANAGQGMNRNDIIAFQYEQDMATMIERGTFVVIQGAETSGAANDPRLAIGDLLDEKTTFDQMEMWRVSVSGATIAAPEQLFGVLPSLSDHFTDFENPHFLTADKVGADPNGSAASALKSAKEYADGKIVVGTTEVNDGDESSNPEGTIYVVI